MSQQHKHAQVSQTTKVVLNSTVANSFLFAALVDFVEACREQGVDPGHYVSCGANGLTWAREVREI